MNPYRSFFSKYTQEDFDTGIMQLYNSKMEPVSWKIHKGDFYRYMYLGFEYILINPHSRMLGQNRRVSLLEHISNTDVYNDSIIIGKKDRIFLLV